MVLQQSKSNFITNRYFVAPLKTLVIQAYKEQFEYLLLV
jgi:hypothetical protein